MHKLVFIPVFLLFIACKKDHDSTANDAYLKTDSFAILFLNVPGAKDSFNVQSNIKWSITISPSTANWFSISLKEGNGNMLVHVTEDSVNTADTVRLASIVITATDDASVEPVYVNIIQPNQPVEYRNAFGGSEQDEFRRGIATGDGGYIVVGSTGSNDGDISGLHGNNLDLWIAKMDAGHKLVWQKILGGTGEERGSGIVKTPDGNYLVVARSNSSDGDLAGAGVGDVWLVKINGMGDVLWKKRLDYSVGDITSMISANGGGYLITGGGSHCEIMKIDEQANIVWETVIGGFYNDFANSAVAVSDGYMIAGETQSNDGDITGNHGLSDALVFKLNEMGNKVWLKCFGGTQEDGSQDMIKTADGGFVIAGFSASNDGDVTGNKGNGDLWVFKLDANGNKVWQKMYGGSQQDVGVKIIQSADGGIVISGGTLSNDGDVTGYYATTDAWVIQLDAMGNKVWQNAYGGSLNDWFNFVLETAPGKFIGGGITQSSDHNVVGHHREGDGWILPFK